MPARACPRCKSLMDVPTGLLNRAVECPTCNATFTPDGPKMATVLAAKTAAPVVPTVVSKPRQRFDEPRPRRRKQSGANWPLVAILGGGGVLLVVAVAVGIGVFAFSGRGGESRDETSPTRSADTYPTQFKWQRESLCNNELSISFPGPNATKYHMGGDYWTPDCVCMLQLIGHAGVRYGDRNPADPFPESEAPEMAKQLRYGGKLIRTERVNFDGKPGRDYEVEARAGDTMYTRLIALDNATRVVELTAFGSRLTRADARTFFESLQFTPAPPKPPITRPPVTQPPISQPPVTQPPVVGVPPKPKSELPDGWTKYEFPDKSASVAMPGTPVASEGEVAPGIRVTVADVTGSDGLKYTISYASEPTDPRANPGTSAYILMSRASLERTFNRRADRDVPVAFSGVIGREIEYRDRDGKGVRVRYYKAVKGNETRVYAIQLAGPLPDATAKNTFVDSFKISWP